jgi:putative lipoprotein
VTGQVDLQGVTAPAGSRLVLEVEDVSRADAPALGVASLSVELSHPLPRYVPFKMEVGSFEIGASYALRAHLDVDGDGQISPGDFVTTESHPVLGDDLSEETIVRLTRV